MEEVLELGEFYIDNDLAGVQSTAYTSFGLFEVSGYFSIGFISKVNDFFGTHSAKLAFFCCAHIGPSLVTWLSNFNDRF
ncbi:MAG: hypothetical protein JKY52_18175 [Flavobacteriales bacterium]|nr:hypothetical protein [Flavobacteriales bacterium]